MFLGLGRDMVVIILVGLMLASFPTGILSRKAQRVLWSWCFHTIKLPVFLPIFGCSFIRYGNNHLLHGEIPEWIFPLCIFHIKSLWLYCCGRELHDDCGIISFQFPDGDYNRSRNTGNETYQKTLIFLFHYVIRDFISEILMQGIMMMTSGFFRLLPDLPKPVWRYPISYISYGSWSLQVIKSNDELTSI